MNSRPVLRSNFAHLKQHDEQLLRLGMLAERYFAEDPNTCLLKLRQFSELLAQITASNVGILDRPEEGQYALLLRLRDQGITPLEIYQLFGEIRRTGNAANHALSGNHKTALTALKFSWQLGVWFHRTFGKPDFKSGPFIPPNSPVDESAELRAELESLSKALAEHQAAHQEKSQQLNSLEAELRAAKDEQSFWENMAAEVEAEKSALQARLTMKQAALSASQSSTLVVAAVSLASAKAASLIELDEAAIRRLIDGQLRQAGWEVDTEILRYSKGTRPQKRKNLAIAEWPTTSGPVDYALFVGLELVAVVEAKRFKKDLPSVLGQAQRYARDIVAKGSSFHSEGPWGEFKVPFVYVGNGRPYLRQIQEKSGIHFHDLRKPTNHPHALDGWPSPEGLMAALAAEVSIADEALAETAVDLPGLRHYQVTAIRAVEEAIAAGRRDIMLAMATGTGKTRTAVSLIYRLIKSKRFRRILFLVDRTELGKQAYENGFDQIKLEQLQTFTEIYDVRELGEAKVDPETKVHIATVQSMVHRVLLSGNDPPPPVDQYDCIIIDECHRGYNLDREMAEHELAFRSEEDFIAKYRRVVDHFFAVKIGLTATPALHTAEIFGRPIFTYSYREAVTDGFLCDHHPPIRIVTNLTASGIKWKKGEDLRTYDPGTGTIDLFQAPDEVLKEVDSFNREVITEPFNRTICKELVAHLDPANPGKTLVFCARDSHADLFVRVLKEEMDAHWGPQSDSMIAKITGSSLQGDDKLIKKFKNEVHPQIGVTVDLLSTGIDIPKITRLVFVRRVRSRILYEQMLGRATRLCENLFGEGLDKEAFEIFDAVDLYAILEDFSSMKPVVVHPTASIADHLEWIQASSGEARERFAAELVVKIRRLRKRIERKAADMAIIFGGLTPEELEQTLGGSPEEIVALFGRHAQLASWLQNLRQSGTGGRLLISDHEDSVKEVGRGYGSGRQKPEDYLQSFTLWIEENRNKNAALLAVLTRPSDLTRADLRSLMITMSDAGFMENHLREAWREVKHQDCPARIVGYIRSQALGCPLVPFDQRVDSAVNRLVSTKEFLWTQPQRKWLERIAKQIKQEGVVDETSLKAGAFAAAGGFSTINKSFSGRLPELLVNLHAEIWNDAA